MDKILKKKKTINQHLCITSDVIIWLLGSKWMPFRVKTVFVTVKCPGRWQDENLSVLLWWMTENTLWLE